MRKIALLLVVFASVLLAAQSTTYTITQVSSMMGSPTTMQVARNGDRAVIDNLPASAAGPKVRTYYDLAAGRSFSWNPANPSAGCSSGTFSGDWGDPFASSADMLAQLDKESPKPVGEATLNGVKTTILQTDGTGPGKLKAKAWVDTAHKLLIKAQIDQGGTLTTLVEITKVDLTAPPASIFKLPPACAAAAAAPKPETETERYARETGDPTGQFMNANMPPPSPNSCMVRLRVVQAGTMNPITSIQVAIDRNIDVDHPASYNTGISTEGHYTFSGGSIRELTQQVRNGELKLSNFPDKIQIAVAFGKAGEVDGLIYRQCFTPTTTLLLVIKNPQQISDGADFIWAKSGKFASQP